MKLEINGKRFDVTRETKTCYVVNPKGVREVFFGKSSVKEIEQGVIAPTVTSWRLIYTKHQLSQFE